MDSVCSWSRGTQGQLKAAVEELVLSGSDLCSTWSRSHVDFEGTTLPICVAGGQPATVLSLNSCPGCSRLSKAACASFLSKTGCFSQLAVAVIEHLRVESLHRKSVYLSRSSGSWKREMRWLLAESGHWKNERVSKHL